MTTTRGNRTVVVLALSVAALLGAAAVWVAHRGAPAAGGAAGASVPDVAAGGAADAERVGRALRPAPAAAPAPEASQVIARVQIVDAAGRPAAVAAHLRSSDGEATALVSDRTAGILASARAVERGAADVVMESRTTGVVRTVRAEFADSEPRRIVFDEPRSPVRIRVTGDDGTPVEGPVRFQLLERPAFGRAARRAATPFSGAAARDAFDGPPAAGAWTSASGPEFDAPLAAGGFSVIEVATDDGRAGSAQVDARRAGRVEVRVAAARDGTFVVRAGGARVGAGAVLRMYDSVSSTRAEWSARTDDAGRAALAALPDRLLLASFTLHLDAARAAEGGVPDALLVLTEVEALHLLDFAREGGATLDFPEPGRAAWRIVPPDASAGLAGRDVCVWPSLPFLAGSQIPAYLAGRAAIGPEGIVELPAWIAGGAADVTLDGALTGVRLVADAAGRTLALPVTRTLRGSVADSGGAPIAGAAVRWSGRREGLHGHAFRRTAALCDASGRFELVVTDEPGALLASAPGHVAAVAEAGEGDAADREIRLERIGTATVLCRSPGSEGSLLHLLLKRRLPATQGITGLWAGGMEETPLREGEASAVELFEGAAAYEIEIWDAVRALCARTLRDPLAPGDRVEFALPATRLRNVEVAGPGAAGLVLRLRWESGGAAYTSVAAAAAGPRPLAVPEGAEEVHLAVLSAGPGSGLRSPGLVGGFEILSWKGRADAVPATVSVAGATRRTRLIAAGADANVAVWSRGRSIAAASVRGRSEDRWLDVPAADSVVVTVAGSLGREFDAVPPLVDLSEWTRPRTIRLADDVARFVAEGGKCLLSVRSHQVSDEIAVDLSAPEPSLRGPHGAAGRGEIRSAQGDRLLVTVRIDGGVAVVAGGGDDRR